MRLGLHDWVSVTGFMGLGLCDLINVTGCALSDGQVVSRTDCSVNGAVRSPHECRFQCSVRSYCTAAFYDTIAGPTVFIISIVNSVKMAVWVTHGAVIAHRFTYAPPRCRTSQYRRTFIPLSVSLWNDLSDPVFDGVGLAGFKSRANYYYY